MRRRLLAIVISALVALSLVCTAYSHPGGTDGSGGHHDRSDGSYHYHHGYSAHHHYDMDGDGTVDCPYDFDDQTGRNSGSSSSSKSSYSSSTGKKTQKRITFAQIFAYVYAIPLTIFWIACLLFPIYAIIADLIKSSRYRKKLKDSNHKKQN